MAISKNFSTVYGIELSPAYIRIEDIRIFSKTVMSFSVCYYADSSKAAIEIKKFECSYDVGGENPLAQAYAHVKALPEFADALDC